MISKIRFRDRAIYPKVIEYINLTSKDEVLEDSRGVYYKGKNAYYHMIPWSNIIEIIRDDCPVVKPEEKKQEVFDATKKGGK